MVPALTKWGSTFPHLLGALDGYLSRPRAEAGLCDVVTTIAVFSRPPPLPDQKRGQIVSNKMITEPKDDKTPPNIICPTPLVIASYDHR